MSKLLVLCVLLLGVIGYVEYRLAGVGHEIDDRPKIAILPVERMIKERLAKDPTQPVAEVVKEINALSGKLAEAGYVVLDERNVYAYPIDYLVGEK